TTSILDVSQEEQMRYRLGLLLGCLLTLLLTVPAFGALTGDLQGTVVDPTGAVITGAQVTIRNLATGVTKTVTTNSSGEFAALQLDLGEYEVSVEKQGLKTLKQTA